MIELEVYAKGLRSESALMEFHNQMDLMPAIHYKVDTHHDLVYFEIEPGSGVTLRFLNEAFTNIGLIPRIVGQVPAGLAEGHSGTQRLV
jgi:hypothetical protein